MNEPSYRQNRLAVLLTLAIFAFSSCGLALGAESPQFEEENYDLGVVERNQPPRYLTIELPLLNKTKSKLSIVKLQGNCSCFTVEGPAEIEANGKVIVKATIDKYSARSKTHYAVAAGLSDGNVVATSFTMTLLDKVRVSSQNPITVLSDGTFVSGKELLLARTFALEPDAPVEQPLPTLEVSENLFSNNVEFSVSHISSEEMSFPKQKIVTSFYVVKPLRFSHPVPLNGYAKVPISIRWRDGVSSEINWRFENREALQMIPSVSEVEGANLRVEIIVNALKEIDIKGLTIFGLAATDFKVVKVGESEGGRRFIVHGNVKKVDVDPAKKSFVSFKNGDKDDQAAIELPTP